MPNWNSPRMKGIRNFIVHYVAALNDKDYNTIEQCFTPDAILHRGMKNYAGRDEMVNWYRKQLNSGRLRFELMDASAGVLPDGSALSILWLEIKTKGNSANKNDIHIESLDLIQSDGCWKIRKCFGLGFDPEYHKRHFQQDANGCDE